MHLKRSNKLYVGVTQPNGGVQFGPQYDIDMDLTYDEVYLWDRHQEASVFSTLYTMDV